MKRQPWTGNLGVAGQGPFAKIETTKLVRNSISRLLGYCSALPRSPSVQRPSARGDGHAEPAPLRPALPALGHGGGEAGAQHGAPWQEDAKGIQPDRLSTVGYFGKRIQRSETYCEAHGALCNTLPSMRTSRKHCASAPRSSCAPSQIREGTREFAERAESEGPRTPARATAESASSESASESPPQLRTPRSPGLRRRRLSVP